MVQVLLWSAVVHLAAIYLFTRGFLLTRHSLPHASSCSQPNCGITPTHKRAVLIIVDALRFDFIATNPPHPRSPFHHNLLTVPQQLTRDHPAHSFIFNAYADPPTTTLQRIKALTTGSLPTFVDIGNNFGGSSITEDSIIKQLSLSGKKSAFMGDDTWMSVFPHTFEHNMTFPFDSFNVEDLHTVDEGVIHHLFPLLQDPSNPFDFLVAHFLGVDHVGHRMGPDHPSMIQKLTQINNVLDKVVNELDDDTLLVVLGDHGMDKAGDHGGEGALETSSAMWIYSKGPPLTDVQADDSVPSGLLQYTTYPGCDAPHRSIQQIDIVPTLSLLLGIPIPFNSLGSVIPELFWRGTRPRHFLRNTLRINAEQIMRYLHAYRSSPSGGELDDAWDRIRRAWDVPSSLLEEGKDADADDTLVALNNFNRVALAACREMWAQFNPVLMALGLALLIISFGASWAVYCGIANRQHKGQDYAGWLAPRLSAAARNAAGAAVVGCIAHFPLASLIPGITFLDLSLFFAGISSCITLILLSSPPTISLPSLITLKSTPILLLLHSTSFFSNSFTFWEDRLVPFLLITSLIPAVREGLAAPSKRLRRRILGFAALCAGCVRLMGVSTVCREEQGAECRPSYFWFSAVSSATSFSTSSTSSDPLAGNAGAGATSNPSTYLPALTASTLALLTALALPYFINRFLRTTRSDEGIARVFLPGVVLPALVCGAVYWVLDLVESEFETELGLSFSSTATEAASSAAANSSMMRVAMMRVARTWIARVGFMWIVIGGGVLWWLVPICVDVRSVVVGGGQAQDSALSTSTENEGTDANSRKQETKNQETKQIQILGFANAYGSSYVLFWTIPLGAVFLATQLTGQVALALGTVAMLAWFEVRDSVGDAREMRGVFEGGGLASSLSLPASSSPASSSNSMPSSASSSAKRPNLTRTEFTQTTPLALLALHAFYTTGHQAAFASIQWKAGFMVTPGAHYVWSLVTVVLNSVGPFVVFVVGGVGVGWWCLEVEDGAGAGVGATLEDASASKNEVEETTKNDPTTNPTTPPLLAALSLSMYFTALLIGASLSAAFLRRHLMVWKVFAPRFMVGVMHLVAVDVGVILGVGVGVRRVVWGVRRVFGGRGMGGLGGRG